MDRLILEHWWGRFNPKRWFMGYHFTQEYLSCSTNKVGEQYLMFCESSFWSVDGAYSIWAIAFCWHSAKESLQYSDNHVAEQCLVVCEVHFGVLMGHIQSGPLLLAWHSAQESLQYLDNHVDEQCLVFWESSFWSVDGTDSI